MNIYYVYRVTKDGHMVYLASFEGEPDLKHLAETYGFGRFAIGPTPHADDCQLADIAKSPNS